MASIYLSEYINLRNNGILVTPWEVKDIPDEYLGYYRAMQKAAKTVKRKTNLESLFAAHRRNHKSYRKY